IVQNMADPASFEGVVRLGVTELVGMTWLARLVSQISLRYPRVQLMPEIDGGITLYERLEQDQLDVAIMPGPFWSYQYDC
ncbi:LysR substrate-binding domain-containing protein, partial [Burkholderia sp. SIMBA_019]|uniref:LysR substrate-binding domain-containing protein n=1 Tax=Burkholderia sp. SIMBA_019 TaxID=3085765 RepID=UPI00397DA8AA